MAGVMIEKLPGKSFGTNLSESGLEPLDVQQTTTQPDFRPYDNVAGPHMSLCSATPLPVNQTYFFKDTFFEPAGGLYSNFDECLNGPRLRPRLLIDPFLFAETESAVVVLTNSVPLNDAADWLAQAYITALFGFPSPADYVSLAWESRRKKVSAMESMRPSSDEIRKAHPDDRPRLPLASCSGRYVTDAGNFFIDVGPYPEKSGEALLLRFRRRVSHADELRHVRGEVFEWSLACDESARQLRFPVIEAEYYEVRFESDGGRPKSLTWAGIGIRMLRSEGGGGGDGSKDQVRMGHARQWREEAHSAPRMIRAPCPMP
jgi:hypothetical protein